MGETQGLDGSSSSTGFRYQKLEMPLFDISNLNGWSLKAKQYFTLNQLTNEEKLEVAEWRLKETLYFGFKRKIGNNPFFYGKR